MTTILGQNYKKTIGRTPPHMSAEDEIIWNSWKQTNLTDEMDLYFDVGLGDGIQPPAGIDPDIAEGWIRNTQKRADLIVYTGSDWWIVEFRYNATANAVGRLLLYEMLFIEDLPKDQPITLILATNRYDKDIKKLCDKYRIQYNANG